MRPRLQESNFAFAKGTPSPPAAELPPRKEPLKDYPLRVAALIGLWLLNSYKTPPTLVGGHSVHPRSWESNFSLKRGTPSPPTAELPPRKEPLQDDPLRVAALIDLWLLHCYKTPPTFVGARFARPRS